ncbi:MAG: D-serine ammonia-lyase, partial [Firmicutes bacterium]|nr:D-serine ammonia-lyase [Bacillota bacterium]
MNNLLKKDPLIEDIANCKEIFWVNPNVDAKPQHADALVSADDAKADPAESVDIDAAEARLLRFAPFIAKMFPDAKDGIIESELKEISRMKELLVGGEVKGRLFL